MATVPQFFRIRSSAQHSLVLDVSAKTQSANVIFNTAQNVDTQKWTFDGTAVKNCGTNFVLDVRSGLGIGHDVIQYKAHGGVNQQWTFKPEGQLAVLNHEMYLSHKGDSVVAGVAAVIADHGDPLELVAYEEISQGGFPNGGFRVVSLLNDQIVLDLDQHASLEKAKTHLVANNPSKNSSSQRWSADKTTVSNSCSKMALDLINGVGEGHSAVQQAVDASVESQQWKFDEKTSTIRSVSDSNCCLTLQVVVSKDVQGTHQKWKFYEYDETDSKFSSEFANTGSGGETEEQRKKREEEQRKAAEDRKAAEEALKKAQEERETAQKERETAQKERETAQKEREETQKERERIEQLKGPGEVICPRTPVEHIQRYRAEIRISYCFMYGAGILRGSNKENELLSTAEYKDEVQPFETFVFDGGFLNLKGTDLYVTAHARTLDEILFLTHKNENDMNLIQQWDFSLGLLRPLFDGNKVITGGDSGVYTRPTLTKYQLTSHQAWCAIPLADKALVNTPGVFKIYSPNSDKLFLSSDQNKEEPGTRLVYNEALEAGNDDIQKWTFSNGYIQNLKTGLVITSNLKVQNDFCTLEKPIDSADQKWTWQLDSGFWGNFFVARTSDMLSVYYGTTTPNSSMNRYPSQGGKAWQRWIIIPVSYQKF